MSSSDISRGGAQGAQVPPWHIYSNITSMIFEDLYTNVICFIILLILMPKMMQIACMNSCASGVTVEAAEMTILNYF